MNAITIPSAVTPAAIDVSYVRRAGLKAFIEVVWGQLDPAPFIDDRHIDEIASHLEAVYDGRVKNLLVNQPPATSKSTLLVAFNLWVWIQDPRKKFICASFDDTLALRDARRVRNVIKSDWWAARWPHVRIPKGGDESTAAGEFYTTRMGMRKSVSIGFNITGFHGDFKIVDDPNKQQATDGTAEVNLTQLQSAINWWDGAWSSRNTDLKKTATVVVMQRLHQRDLTGYILESAKTGGESFEHLRLPMEFEAGDACKTSVGGDWRTEEGELLCPNRVDAESVAIGKTKLKSSRNIAAQNQQRPTAREGNIIKAGWLRHVGPCSEGCRKRECPGAVFPEMPRVDEMKLGSSWDLTFKAGTKNDYVCGQVWGHWRGYACLIDQFHGRLSFTDTLREFRKMAEKWPRAFVKRVEKAANAEALHSILRKEIPGIELESPKGSKEYYVTACEGMFESGMVLYPSPRDNPWVEEINFHELTNFPAAAHDDSVDATTHELYHIAKGTSTEALTTAYQNAAEMFKQMGR